VLFVNIQFNGDPIQVIFQPSISGRSPNTSAVFDIRRRDFFQEKTLAEKQRDVPPVVVSSTPSPVVNINRGHMVTVNVTALKEDLPKSIKALADLVSEISSHDDVEFDNPITEVHRKELDAIALKFGVEIELESNKKVRVRGLEKPVSQAVKVLVRLMIQSAAKKVEKPPDSWEQQTENTELKDVAKQSSEWEEIEKKAKNTLPTIKIIKISRVQNLWQWERYAFHRNRLGKKSNNNNNNDSGCNEVFLFHGSRTNDPALIFNGDEGFDMRYCEKGMWGRASYFAHNASYSDAYCFQSGGTKQMFYARVSLGQCAKVSPPNPSLVKPPEGFDSVSGNTNGSDIYMVYENGRAYPEYLIIYT